MTGLKAVISQQINKIMIVAFLWATVISYVLTLIDFTWVEALIHSLLLHGFLVIGFWFLSNIFSFYSPRNRHFWVLLMFPLGVSLVLSGSINFIYNSIPNHFISVQWDEVVFFIHVLYFMLFLTFWSILLVFSKNVVDARYLKEREDANLKIAKEAELHYLKQQFQPHFLFNSLNSINSLIGSKPELARKMVIKLAEFLRSTLRQDGRKWVSISEEIEQLNLFLSIEKVRFGNRLIFIMNIQESAKSCEIPQLLIQPLLENAIKHGLNGTENQVEITLDLEIVGNNLSISIKNPFDLKKGQADGNRFGLETLERRLFLMFGRSDLLKIDAKNQLFKVQLTIPQTI
jgi:two-component system, LytTR family, sensor kinase